MSQEAEENLKIKLQEAEAARANAAKEWELLDAALYSELPQTKKLGVLSHIRTRNRATGKQWATAAHHARAMSVGGKQAERTMRTLQNEGVLELVEAKQGDTNTVVLAQSWEAKTRERYLEWRKKRPRTPKAGVGVTAEGTPDAHVPGTPDARGRGPRTPTSPYPFRDPASLSADSGVDNVDPPGLAPPTVTSSSKSSKTQKEGGAELYGPTSQKVDQEADKKGEIPGFSGDTWVWVTRLCKLDAIKPNSFERYRVRNRMTEVAAATSPQAVRDAIVALEAAAAAKTLAGTASRALLGWARRAEHQPAASHLGRADPLHLIAR